MTTAPVIPLAEQAAKLDRILDDRVRLYKLGVSKKTVKLAEAAQKHAEVEAIRRSFRFLVDNAGWIRAEAQRRRNAHATDAEWDGAANDGAEEERALAGAVLAEFPDATVTITAPETAAA